VFTGFDPHGELLHIKRLKTENIGLIDVALDFDLQVCLADVKAELELGG